MSYRFAALLVSVVALGRISVASGQEFSARQVQGAAILLADQRVAVVIPSNGRLEVASLVGDAVGNAPTDIRQGDEILAIDTTVVRTFSELDAHYKAIAVGKTVTVRLRRDGSERTVTFVKPPRPAGEGTRMPVALDGGSGAGAWTVQGLPTSGDEVVIAGIHIRNNSQGMPEVVFKAAHPAQGQVPLMSGDVVTAVNGKSIAALAGLEMFYKEAATGAEVSLTVTRRGTSTTVTFRKPAS